MNKLVEAYTLETLQNDILNRPTFHSRAASDIKREYKHKHDVLQMLMNIPLWTNADDNDKKDKVKLDIKNKVYSNNLLAGFNFYLSHNAQFDYTWNYLRKKVDGYITFLQDARIFIMTVIADINVMAEKLRSEDGIKIIFHDVIETDVKKDVPYAKSVVIWDNFDNIANIKDGYYVTVKKGDAVLITSFRSYKAKVDDVLEKTLKQIERSKRI